MSPGSAFRTQLREVVEGFTWDYHPASTRSLRSLRSTRSAKARSTGSLGTMRSELCNSLASSRRATFHRACVSSDLIVRTGSSLESPESGRLKVGTVVTLLQDCTLPNGIVRTKVGRDSEPRGLTIETVGWITSFKPKPGGRGGSGQHFLERAEEGVSHESMASRIKERRASQALERYVPPPTVGPGSWMTSDTLAHHATAQRALARSLEAKVFDQCEERIGIMIVTFDLVTDDIGPRCDFIGAGDELDRLKFRRLVRNLVSPGALITQEIGSDAEIDQLFRSLDIDGGGTLDRREVAAAFAKLKVAHKRPKYKAATDTIFAQREAADALDGAAALTRRLDAAEAAFAAVGGATVSARLGDLLAIRAVKMEDLRNLWDKNGDGKLDAEELAQNLTEFGFERAPRRLRALNAAECRWCFSLS